MNGADCLARFLKEKGVGFVFDYPGNCLLPVYPALERQGIRHYTMRSEAGAVFAASGVSRTDPKSPGVVFATSGPGATNLVTGLADAMLDSIPLIAFTGQVSTAVIGQDAFQEADLLGITLPITKHNFLVKDAALLPTVLEEAWRIALFSRPGPVLVDLPQDVLSSDKVGESAKNKLRARLPHERKTPPEKDLSHQKDALFDLLSRAKKPLFLFGGGCRRVSALAKKACETLQIPCVHTLMGKGVLPDLHPLSYGMVGIHGARQANQLLRRCDTLIAVGCRFSDRTLPDPDLLRGKCVLHIDLDPAEIGKRFFCALGAVADAGRFFSELERAALAPFASWAEPKKPETVRGFCLSHALNAVSDAFPDAVFVTDVGVHQMLAANHIPVQSPDRFLSSGGLGAMGFGLGAALGAAICAARKDPDRKVVLLVGDGGLQMTLGELASIKEFSLSNLHIVLCDNRALGLVEELNRLQKRSALCPDRTNPDFDALFAAFSIPSFSADSVETLSLALSALKTTPGAALHLHLSPLESAYQNERELL